MSESVDKYAFVVAASDNYLQGIVAMFNSMQYHGMTADVILIPWNLPEEFLNSLGKYRFNFRIVPNEVEHQVLATAIERFRVAVELGPEYEAICLLDADMYFHNPVDLFFDVAAKGFIVTGSNGMIIDFGTGYQEHYGVDLGAPSYPYAKVHTTAPIFISPADLDWFRALYEARRVDSWDDFLFLNVLGIQMDKPKKMLCLPPYVFTGIHHWQMKPETCLIRKAHGLVLTGTEEQVYISHGKFWDEGYCSDQLGIMHRYLADWGMDERCKSRVDGSSNILVEEFNRYLGCMPD